MLLTGPGAVAIGCVLCMELYVLNLQCKISIVILNASIVKEVILLYLTNLSPISSSITHTDYLCSLPNMDTFVVPLSHGHINGINSALSLYI